MDESGTDDRVDSIGTDDLTANESITTTTGKKDNAANFDSSSHSLISTAWRATGVSGFSISAWIRRSDFPSSNAWFVTENVAANPAFGCYVRDDGEGTAFIRNAAVSVVNATTGAFNLPIPTAWVHFCASWNSGEALFLYIDGVERGSSASLSGNLLDNSVGIKFGSAEAGGNDWAGGNEGYTDEVAIWTKGIGEAGAVEIFDAGVGKFL